MAEQNHAEEPVEFIGMILSGHDSVGLPWPDQRFAQAAPTSMDSSTKYSEGRLTAGRGERGPGVAQICNLLYRRIVFGSVSPVPVLSESVKSGGLQIRDTAECNSALRRRHVLCLLLCISCISWFVLAPCPTLASPSSALREYKAGKYDEALKEYERLLQKKSDDPRLHFNAGAAAYRNRQFDEAAKQFNATLSSPDLKLQGLAYYNEGNSLYHLGEQNPDPKQRTDAWEKAIADYQSTLKLNPKDADAKFNYEFVKRRLEELKQQQQQQNQQNNQDQNQKQDQQKQQQGQNQQQNQPKQQNGQQQKQQQQQAQQDQTQQSAKQQQAEQQKKEQEQKQAAQKAEQQKQQQAQQQAGQPKEKSDEKDQQAAQAMAQMTPEQAKQLLDAQKGDEQMLPPKDLGKPVDQSRSFKDW